MLIFNTICIHKYNVFVSLILGLTKIQQPTKMLCNLLFHFKIYYNILTATRVTAL